MRASLEPVRDPAYIIRVHEAGSLGDPFVWACVAERYDDEAAVLLKAAVGPFRREIIEAAQRELYAAGYRWAEFERRKNGLFVRSARIPIKPDDRRLDLP